MRYRVVCYSETEQVNIDYTIQELLAKQFAAMQSVIAYQNAIAVRLKANPGAGNGAQIHSFS